MGINSLESHRAIAGRLWEVLCAIIVFAYIFEAFQFFRLHQYFGALSDMIFFIDLVLRYKVAQKHAFWKPPLHRPFRKSLNRSLLQELIQPESPNKTEVVNNKQPKSTEQEAPSTVSRDECNDILHKRRIFLTWLLIDLFLSLPYGTLFYLFESLAVFRIVHIKSTTTKPIINFLTKRSFRKDLFKALREHFAQRKAINSFFLNFLSHTQKRFSALTIVRRIGRFLGIFAQVRQINGRLRLLQSYLVISKQFSLLLLFLRGFSFVLARAVAIETYFFDPERSFDGSTPFSPLFHSIEFDPASSRGIEPELQLS
jgi:hypothetical protein